MASSRAIIIEVDLKDNASGQIGGLKKTFAEIEARAQRTRNKLLQLGRSQFRVTLSLIDRITPAGSKINTYLRSMAAKQYLIGVKLTENVFGRIQSLTSTLQRLVGRSWTIGINLRDNVSKKISGLTEGLLMGAGGAMTGMLGTMGAGYGVASALQSYAGFEKQSSRVQALLQVEKDSAEMLALTDQAKKLGMETAWSREQAMKAIEFEVLAGWQTPQILKATPHILNVASAGGMELGAASDLFTDAMTAFGLKATDKFKNAAGQMIDMPQYFADMLVKVQASSNQTLEQLREAIKFGAPTIGAMFANVEGQEGVQMRTEAARQFMIMSGLLANSSIKGSMGGTGINTLFNRLAGGNRNTHFAEKLLGLEHAENGNMLMPLDFIKAFQRKAKEGMKVEDVFTVMEELEGTKLNADTRRKLDSTIANAIKNGGKLGSEDILKMASMTAGLENAPKLMAMLFQDVDALEAKMKNVEGTASGTANTMLDNLSGSVTKFLSAFDSLRQGIFEGNAGAGLRGFVDTLTELTTRANKLFADGIDWADPFLLITDVVDRLKTKFAQMDGIGSILAGGALMAAFVKIGRTIQRVIGYAGQLKGLQIGQMLGGATGAKGGTVSAASQVGTMHVTAGVVNIAGRTGTGGVGGIGGTSTSTRIGAAMPSAIVTAQKNLASAQLARDNALAAAWASPGVLWRQQVLRREQANVAQAERTLINARVAAYNEQIAQGKQAAALARSQRNATFASGAMGGALFAGLFGAMELFSTKSLSAERAKEAADALNLARSEYQELVRQNRPLEELAQHAEKIQGLETDQKRILQENKSAERDALAGVTGSVLGAAVGAGLGSIAGPLGTTIGSVIGGVIGDFLGRKANEIDTSEAGEPKFGEAAATNLTEVREESKMIAGFHARRATGGRATAEATQSKIAAMQDRARMVQEKSPMLNSYNEKLQKYINDLQYGTGAQGATQDFYRRQSEILLSQIPAQVLANQQKGWDLLHDISPFSGTAHAATLSEEQLLQQAQMERPLMGNTVSDRVSAGLLAQPTPEMSQPESTPLDFSSIAEQLYSDMESFTEGINELFSGIGESISETLTTSFEGIGETFSGFTDSITENLTSAFEGVDEYFNEVGAMFSENLAASFESVGETFNSLGSLISESLTTSFEGAGEMFTAFGESLTSTLTTAQATAESSLLAIGTAFETTKSTVQTSWAELPGFFEGIFSGLGGAASSAGAAIHAGLTAPIGSIIGAWQGAAAQISSIISSISAQAAAMPSVANIGGGGSAYAEGGFVNSPTQALIGEAGAEVVIPLSGSKRSRALDLFNKTAAILGGEAAIPMADFTADNVPELDSSGGFTLDAQAPVATRNQSATSASAEVNIGGVNVTFNISGAKDPQQVLDTIKENLENITDKIAGQLGSMLPAVWGNMAVKH